MPGKPARKQSTMSENYYRLLKLLVEPCTRVLLELLETFARNDLVTAGQPFTSIEAYISTKKTFLKSKLGKDQFRTVYPHSGVVDANKWDISVLCSLSIGLFFQQGHNLHTHITSIRSERNNLSHKTSTTDILDSEFTRIWVGLKSNILRAANFAKGSTFQTEISEEIDVLETSCVDPVSRLKLLETWNETLTKSFADKMLSMQRKISGQTGVMQQLSTKVNVHKSITVRLEKSSNDMYRKIGRQKVKIEKLHEKVDSLKEKSDRNAVVLGKAITKRKSLESGKIIKRIRTENNYEERFKDRFQSTLQRCLPDDFHPPKEIDAIVDNLTTGHFVVVCGHKNTVYLQTALKAIKSMIYDESRCVQLTNVEDWVYIEPREISLVLFKDPFGGFFFDKKMSKGMIEELDEIKGSKVDVVIVTRQDRLHDVNSKLGIRLPSVVEVKERMLTNTESQEASPSTFAEPKRKPDMYFNNLNEITKCYRNQRKRNADDEVVSDHVKNGRQKLKEEHWMFLLGNDHDVIKDIALEIADTYGENEYVLLTNPDDILHIDVKMTSLLVIEHFAGRYRFDSYKARNWLEAFVHISAMSCNRQLDVIVTSGQDQMKGCVEEFGENPLFSHFIDVTNKPRDQSLCISEKLKDVSVQCDPAANTAGFSECFFQRHTPAIHDNDLGLSVVFVLSKIIDNQTVVITGTNRDLLYHVASNIFPKDQKMLILPNSENLTYSDLKNMDVLLVEDFAGKYVFDKFKANKWFETFDQIQPNIEAGCLKLVLVTHRQRLIQCKKELGDHWALRNPCQVPPTTQQPLPQTADVNNKAEGGADGMNKITSSPITDLPTLMHVRDMKLSREEKDNCIYGMTVVEDRILIAVKFGSLQLFHLDVGKQIGRYRMESSACDITTLPLKRVAVTLKNDEIHYLKVLKSAKMLFERQINGGEGCRGIVYSDNKLVVSYICPHRKVQILNMDGNILKVFEKNHNGANLFMCPDGLAVSPDNNTIYISDWSKHTVTALSKAGRVLGVVKDKNNLRYPLGVTVDSEGRVYVCGMMSNTVCLVSPENGTVTRLMGEEDGIWHPRSMVVCDKRRRLYFWNGKNTVIAVFNMQ